MTKRRKDFTDENRKAEAFKRWNEFAVYLKIHTREKTTLLEQFLDMWVASADPWNDPIVCDFIDGLIHERFWENRDYAPVVFRCKHTGTWPNYDLLRRGHGDQMLAEEKVEIHDRDCPVCWEKEWQERLAQQHWRDVEAGLWDDEDPFPEIDPDQMPPELRFELGL